MAEKKQRTMSDVELAVMCATYRAQQVDLTEMGKKINVELNIDNEALLVICDATPFSVTGRHTASDPPMFAEIRIPERLQSDGGPNIRQVLEIEL